MHASEPALLDPAVVGQWEPIEFCCVNLPVHVALLHTGKVLSFGGSCNNPAQLHSPRPAELWDYTTGESRAVDQELDGDVFCAGHAFLPDGRLLVAGGTAAYDHPISLGHLKIPFPPFQGLEHTYIFDPVTETWARAGDLSVGRWYPTLVGLGDGRVLAVAGFTRRFPYVALRRIEVYSPSDGWQRLPNADRWMPLYPRLHLLPDGRVFYSGSYNTHYTFPFSLSQFPTSILDPATGHWDGLGLPNRSEREEGATVLLPLRPPDYRPTVLLSGGGTPQGTHAGAECELIDLSEPSPRWRSIDPMRHPRYYVYPVLLPDGAVLMLGGRSGTKGHDHHTPVLSPGAPQTAGEIPHDSLAVMEPELFDPVSATWTALAPMRVDRLYHASALLLPDGRVAVFGSNPARGVYELRIETYRPPYLFRGPRPEIVRAPAAAEYGRSFVVESPQAGEIEQVVLIRPTATTHCLNPEQRLVELEFHSLSPHQLEVCLPSNRSLLPPGYYMLFLLAGRVPSVSRMLRVDGP